MGLDTSTFIRRVVSLSGVPITLSSSFKIEIPLSEGLWYCHVAIGPNGSYLDPRGQIIMSVDLVCQDHIYKYHGHYEHVDNTKSCWNIFSDSGIYPITSANPKLIMSLFASGATGSGTFNSNANYIITALRLGDNPAHI